MNLHAYDIGYTASSRAGRRDGRKDIARASRDVDERGKEREKEREKREEEREGRRANREPSVRLGGRVCVVSVSANRDPSSNGARPIAAQYGALANARHIVIAGCGPVGAASGGGEEIESAVTGYAFERIPRSSQLALGFGCVFASVRFN